MDVSLIVSTYNRPQALDRVLAGIAAQVELPHEVIIADDGSGEPTRELVERWRPGFPVELRHSWQPDEGFRVAQARNRAAAIACGGWLQFIDGDCVPRPHFVARVRRLADPGWLLAGDRVLVSRRLTERIEHERIDVHAWGIAQFLAARGRRDLNRLTPLLYWPWRLGRGIRASDWRHLRGACIGVARDDFVRINGFEQSFSGWGLEDSELAVRALNAGLRIRSGRVALGLLHLWHRENARDRLEFNERLLQEATEQRRTRARVGVAQAIEAMGDAGPR